MAMELASKLVCFIYMLYKYVQRILFGPSHARMFYRILCHDTCSSFQFYLAPKSLSKHPVHSDLPKTSFRKFMINTDLWFNLNRIHTHLSTSCGKQVESLRIPYLYCSVSFSWAVFLFPCRCSVTSSAAVALKLCLNIRIITEPEIHVDMERIRAPILPVTTSS